MLVHDNYKDTIVQGELLLFHTLWNTTNDNMFIARRDKDGVFFSEKTNHALKKMFNLSEEQIDGVSLKNLFDEKSYNKIAKKYEKCIEENRPLSYEEIHILDDTGTRYWNTTILPIVDKENDIIRIFGISREITQLKRLNETLEIEVKKRTEELEEALVKIKEISITDKLTGLYNRHYLDTALEDIQKMAKRHDIQYGLVILDIDDFKAVNDTYGHIVGDVILKEFSLLLKNSIRETDILGRWGGEEFLIIISHTSEESILTLANHIRKKIENNTFPKIKKMTASFGASLIKKGDKINSFIYKADSALFKAKAKGKNRVEIEN